MKNRKRGLGAFPVFCVLLLLAGCGMEREIGQQESLVVDLMEQWEGQTGEEEEMGQAENEILPEAFAADASDFAIALLKENLKNQEGCNVMISPASVLAALSMTANGAEGDTLSQMLSVFAGNQDMDSLNRNMKIWREGLADTDKASLKLANAVWFQDDGRQLEVEEDFLRKNASYYHADMYKAPFNEDTLKSINAWAEEKTEGKVKGVLGRIQEDAVMYLVNTAVFDADWKRIYKSYQVHDSIFTNAEGVQERIPFMFSTESIYIEDENASGFIKPYKEGYRFVAILPKEGIGPEKYMEAMDGEHFRKLLEEARTEVIVETGMPKFQAEYETEMGSILAGMGMENAFDKEKAQFRGIGTSPDKNLYISRVIHKTGISVGELGTEAVAATAVEEAVTEEAPETEIYEVYLKRPFVYAIVEDGTNIPVFIGILNDAG